MDRKTDEQAHGEIEASGDASVIAGGLFHIGDALFAIAEGLNRIAKANEPEPLGEPQEGESYLDGTPRR